MKIVFSVIVGLLMFNAFAIAEVPLGKYELLTFAGWSATITLKEKGEASFVSYIDNEGNAEKGIKNSTQSEKAAKWSVTKDRIRVIYDGIEDVFLFEKQCKEEKRHSCLRFSKIENTKGGKSLLEYEQPFVNFGHLSNLKKWTKAQCKTECEAIKNKGDLKAGVSVGDCIKDLCK